MTILDTKILPSCGGDSAEIVSMAPPGQKSAAGGLHTKEWSGEVSMREKRAIGAVVALGIACVVTLGGCDIVAGIGTYCTEGEDSGCGTTGSGGASGTTIGQGGSSTTATAGGGTGGAECGPVGATQSCYSGPLGTQDVGLCKAGTQQCQDGGAWGACENEVVPKMEDCSKPADEDCNFGVGCSETAWAGMFGDASIQTVRAVAYDGDGNLYAVGKFSGTLDFGGPPLISSGDDVFVVKLDPNGKHLWSQRYGDSAMQDATGVDVDTDGNVIIVGSFSGSMIVQQETLSSNGGSDLYVLKLDPSGSKVWVRQFGDAGNQQYATTVAVDRNTSEIVIVGDFEGTLDFGVKALTTSGQLDALVAKLSKDGDTVWARQFGDGQDQYAMRVALDPSGNIFVAGIFFGTVDFGPGNVLMNGGGDGFLVRFDGDGNTSWAKKMDATQGALPNGVTADSAGNVVMSIETNSNIDVGNGPILVSSYDAILVKYSSGGVFQWQKQLGGSGDDYGPQIATDSNQRIVLSFYSNGPLNLGAGDLPPGGGLDIIVSALEPDGSLRWAKRYGADGDQLTSAVSVGPKGQIGIGCVASGNIDFGKGNLTSKGSDVLLAEIGPN